jgi:hypothetical protein
MTAVSSGFLSTYRCPAQLIVSVRASDESQGTTVSVRATA